VKKFKGTTKPLFLEQYCTLQHLYALPNMMIPATDTVFMGLEWVGVDGI
jgi:hypothetical protein